jgi:hypothetical protein
MENKIVQRPNESPSIGLITGETLADNRAADQNRRRFVKRSLLGLALAPIATLYLGKNAWALSRDIRVSSRGTRYGKEESFPPAELSPDDPEAKALNYSAQSLKKGQSCANCQLYTGSEGKELGFCPIFSYRYSPHGDRLLVKSAGWCRAWASRQPL